MHPPLPTLPASSKRLKPPMKLGDEPSLEVWEVEYGIAWDPVSFVQEASGRSHPGHSMDGVHKSLVDLFQSGGCDPAGKHAIHRTEQMRKWLLRAQELKCKGHTGKECSPSHAVEILRAKNLLLFQELNDAAGSSDVKLAENMAPGFELMGPIPTGGVFPRKFQHATLTPTQVRKMADISRQAIWKATMKCRDVDLAKDVHQITLEERDRGWLKGPYALSELPRSAVLTRRFGVKQSTTLSDGTRTYKTRPIDDISESLVYSTNSMDETIQPMGIDMVLATMALRYRSWGPEELQGKTIDLRKAYKNLPISKTALNDAYICVLDPTTMEPQAFQSQVLPFGARAAVMSFCRVSFALWLIGVVVFKLHWTVFFDDFYLVASKPEAKHVDLAQKLFFQLVGWEVSSEKEAEFDTLARILGVQINLGESWSGIYTICNVETRVKDLVSAIDGVPEHGTLSTAEMRILRGRLVFAEAQIYGRLTGVHMQQLTRWEHAVGDTPLDDEIRHSLAFLRERVVLGGPRRVIAEHGRVFHLYTDACYENGTGGLGGVLYDGFGNQLSFFSATVDEKQVAILNPDCKDTIIFELEALAVFIGCTSRLPSEGLFQNDRLVVFVDNDAVLHRLISGRGGNHVDNQIFQRVLTWECDSNILAWYERVPSSANVADAPSRGDLSSLNMSLAITVSVADVLMNLFGSCPSD